MLYQHYLSIGLTPSDDGYEWAVVYAPDCDDYYLPVVGLCGHSETRESAERNARNALARALMDGVNEYAQTTVETAELSRDA